MTIDPIMNSENILGRFSLRGKVALVTGAGQGIGRAFAHALADAGADVAVIDREKEASQIVSDEIKRRNPNQKSIAITADVTDESQVKETIKEVISELGDLTIACNNVGTGQWIDGENMPYADFQAMMRITLDSV